MTIVCSRHGQPLEPEQTACPACALEAMIAVAGVELPQSKPELGASRPPKPDEVLEALKFARNRKPEHEEGKLTDPERFAVVLAKELKRIATLWASEETEASKEFVQSIERILRDA